MIRKLLLTTTLIITSLLASAQDFNHYFCDSTLRIDYIFAGNSREVRVYPEELNLLHGWYGRRANLDKLPLLGNGDLTMKDKASGRIIYKTSFSSLFQEWIMTPEAARQERSYENVLLVPYPKAPATVEIRLIDKYRQVISSQILDVDPKDILIHSRMQEIALDHEYLHRGGDSRSVIDVVILAEGYTDGQMDDFMKHARQAANELLAYDPFKRHRQNFNIIAVKSPSEDAGISVPREGKWLRTAFGSHFDTFYSERYLTSRRIKAMHEALIGIPYEHIIVLANTDVYGGGGFYNLYTLASVGHKWFLPVVVHEFGHSFAGLADEYFYEEDALNDAYDLSIEPWEQNITTLKDFKGKKWSSLMKRRTPIPTPIEKQKKYPLGLYEGAGYRAKGIYRPSADCRMRSNQNPTFCGACRKAIEELIRFYVPAPIKSNKRR